jgi:hypothetical protein
VCFYLNLLAFTWAYGIALSPNEDICFFDYSTQTVGMIFNKEVELDDHITKGIN